MKLRAIIATVVFSALALTGVMWVGYRQPLVVEQREALASMDIEQPPEVVEEGPFPKAVVDSFVHEFGTAVVGKEYSHTFIVRNEGEAPLILRKQGSSCQCTIGDVDQKPIPPGGSAEVTLTWKPDHDEPRFQHYARVGSNDPEHETMRFEIQGMVLRSIMKYPMEEWYVGEIREVEPAQFTGYIFSPVFKQFDIKEIKSSHELLSAEVTPLTEEERITNEAESGYKIDVQVKPGVGVGKFNETLQFILDREEVPIVNVRGFRPGPITIKAFRNGSWDGGGMVLDMKTFPANEGRTATLLWYVRGLDDQNLEISDVQTDPEFLKINLKRDSSFESTGSSRYFFTVEVPPGSPPMSRIHNSYATVKLKTNHPQVPEFTFRVSFISL